MPISHKKKETFEIVEHTTFELINYDNMLNVSTALSMSGFLVNISKTGGGYIVRVYKPSIL